MFRKGDEPIPGYRLEQFLGKGQFGEVWRTTAPGGTSAALKFIDLGGKQGVKEFRGVQRVKEIRHANLMPITALWLLDGEGNILGNKVMESFDPEAPSSRATLMVSETTLEAKPEWLIVAMLLGQKNLMDRLGECTATGLAGIPVEELLAYMEEAAKGIDYLNSPRHDLGEGEVALQHCDIKPANIMLIGDAAVVCDFGLARVLSDAAATATGMVGSPAYMAPECIRRKPGPGSDQYSLAVSYVELRSGQLPFKELSYVEVLEANRQAKLELSQLAPVEQEVIRKATSLKQEDRYPSAVAMVHALRRAVEGIPEPKPASARPLIAAVALTLAILAPLAAWVVWATATRKPDLAQVTHTLTFEPSTVSVVLNGTPQTLAAGGKLSTVLPPGQPILIEATGPPGYLQLKREYSLDQLQQASFRIQLLRNGDYFAERATVLLAKGEFDNAVKEYEQAVAIDPKFGIPLPIKLSGHTAAATILAVSPDSKWLISAGEDGHVCLWPLAGPLDTPKPVILHGHADGKPIESVSFSSDSRWLLTGGWDATAMVWDLSAADPKAAGVKLDGQEGDVVATAISPQSTPRWLVTASIDGSVRLWPFSNGKPSKQARSLPGHQHAIDNIRVSGDGHWLVTIDEKGNALRWDIQSQSPETSRTSLAKIAHRRHVLQLSPDGKWLISGDGRGKLNAYSLQSEPSPPEVACTTDMLESLALDSSGKQLFVGDENGYVYRLELTSSGEAKLQAKLEGHAASCVAIAVAHDGSFFVTGSQDQTARLWDLTASNTKIPLNLTLPGKNGSVTAVAISPDGKWLAFGSADGTVLLWDVATCRMILHATRGNLPGVKAPTKTARLLRMQY